MPISSLPSKYGIGTLGKSAYSFIDFLEKSGQRYWQILPLNPTGYGDSPYSGFSAFAGNSYLIDPVLLKRDRLVSKEQLHSAEFKGDKRYIDYSFLQGERMKLLELAFKNFCPTAEYKTFCTQNDFWLEDYAQFMAIKGRFGNDLPTEIKIRNSKAMAVITTTLYRKIEFQKFCQFKFFSQWNAVKKYANKKGVQIIGDIPIYVALDSADVWSNPKQFLLDDNNTPIAVSGVPPDNFSKTGQLWGTPLYNWSLMESDGFEWWKQRISLLSKMYDIVRIDHFIGIVNYYAIPYGEKTAENGEYFDGPAQKLIDAIYDSLNGKKIIAEDLGIPLKLVEILCKNNGFPGMKIIETAFEDTPQSSSLPCNFPHNTVAYTGTHDNNTIKGYFKSADSKTIQHAKRYLNVKRRKDIGDALIRAAFASPADTIIIPLQDYLNKGSGSRINTPSTVGDNWRWRVAKKEFSNKLSKKIHRLVITYNRKQSGV